MVGSGSSRASEMLSETSHLMGMVESRGYGARYAVEDESRGDLPMQERRRERVPGHGKRTDEHEHGRGQGASHAHSTSLSTVTGSPPQPRGGSSDVPMGGQFPGPGSGSGPGYQAQTAYSVQPSHPHYGFAQQHTLPPTQVLTHIHVPSQGQYQHEAVSALHATPASGFAKPLVRTEYQAQPQAGVAQAQARTTVPATRAPPGRTSTKRPRAPKRPRPATSTGIGLGALRGNMVDSDDDSDDDEVIEWVPGLDDGSGASASFRFGFSGSAGTGELRGAGGSGSVQAAPGLPGGRKCVPILFRYLFYPPPVVKYADGSSIRVFLLFRSSSFFSNVCTVSLIIPTALQLHLIVICRWDAHPFLPASNSCVSRVLRFFSSVMLRTRVPNIGFWGTALSAICTRLPAPHRPPHVGRCDVAVPSSPPPPSRYLTSISSHTPTPAMIAPCF
ncbi:hypothetical protein J3R83DRAFT_9175 [Lanmaoa asiatica]|nr:hypothetical protein J3R83DRAFT_9175 [Lanmaoa asiatica]